MGKALYLILALMYSFLLPVLVQADPPKKLKNYEVIDGGYADINPGAVVEGSTRHGGLQPDYVIDVESEPLKSILADAKRIGEAPLKYWEKIGAVIALIEKDLFLNVGYEHPEYVELMEKYRSQGSNVPLSEYGVCQSGVCREHALVLHFALKAAGIENYHVYAQIHRWSDLDNYDIVEDHALNVVEHKGTKWVVDAYYWGFNGYRLKDLKSSIGITAFSERAPIAIKGRAGTSRRIEHVNDFPRIYNPIKPKYLSRCSAVF